MFFQHMLFCFPFDIANTNTPLTFQTLTFVANDTLIHNWIEKIFFFPIEFFVLSCVFSKTLLVFFRKFNPLIWWSSANGISMFGATNNYNTPNMCYYLTLNICGM